MKKIKRLIRKIVGNDTRTAPLNDEHQHTWSMVGKTHARAKGGVDVGGDMNLTPRTFEKMIFGVTTILWECTECSETKQEEMLGSDENTLEDILDKVDSMGAQQIRHNGGTYTINKWVPPTPQNGNIPVR